jgi:glyoxylase-like metal-dependent hydrolase (beta-lactamase superfamily II)
MYIGDGFDPFLSSKHKRKLEARMLLRTLTGAALLVTFITTGAAAQDASTVVAAASKAMGADTLTSITYSGTARNGAFGQSKALGDPLGTVNNTQITQYTRTINFGAAAQPTDLVSRAFGPTQPAPNADIPTPMPGQFQQNITAQQATTNFGQALNILTTPWGFLKAAAAALPNTTARSQGGQQVVSFSPAGFMSPSGLPYTVIGFIDNQNRVTKVETRVDNAVVGDLLTEFEYTNYQAYGGVQVPGTITMKQAGLTSFTATINAATPNPTNLTALLTAPPAPARGGGPGGPPAGGRAGGPPPAPMPEMLAAGVFKIGGNYTSLAIDMGDHILVAESGQSDQRGLAVMAAAKAAIPGKPIRFVTTSHGHFDHAGGLATAVAEGATILAHRNTEPALERFLAGPRTLIGDSLSKVANRRTDVVTPVGDRDVRRGTNGRVVELIHIPNEHTDGMLAVYLPAEKIIHTGDVTVVNPAPAQVGVVKSAQAVFNRLNLDFNTWVPAHPPNPDRPITKAEVMAVGAN